MPCALVSRADSAGQRAAGAALARDAPTTGCTRAQSWLRRGGRLLALWGVVDGDRRSPRRLGVRAAVAGRRSCLVP